jgi:Ca2+-binding RTX toxin-like protein
VHFPTGLSRALLALTAALLVVLLRPLPARTTEGNIFADGIRWCASTHPDHGTIAGFGPALDLNGSGADDYRWPLYAPEDGRVRIYSTSGPWGNSVVWTSAHRDERIHLAHLDSVEKTGSVRAGDRIGRVGNTGSSDGSHVHTSAQRGGRSAGIVLGGRAIHAGDCNTSRGPAVPTCRGRDATIVGTGRRDVLAGTRRADVIVAGGGADRISGRGGRDLVCSGKGNDVVRGGHGPDLLVGGWGTDVLTGDRGSDQIMGKGGIDLLAGGSGGDRLTGGPGRDRVSFAGSARAVRVDLGEGWSRGQGNDKLVAIESVAGSAFADVLSGSRRANELLGRAGHDSLNGGAGRDRAHGGPGTDECVAEDTEGCESDEPTPAPSPTPSPSPAG